jgi:short subunit dehydrogenase-like uncharacterized protein
VTRPRDRSRTFDVVLWGATGFTGALVAEYLAQHRADDLRWAIAGRSKSKLEGVRARLSAIDDRLADLPLLVGDSHDRASLDAIAEQASVVCTTVGPYAMYGEELVAACVAAGTDYCDLTGETQFIRRMIDAHHDDAIASGARIVHCCGFDSIPSDLGTLVLQNAAQDRNGRACDRVTLYVDRTKGGMSGGTAASVKQMMEEVERDPGVRKILGHPYALNPAGERKGPDGSDARGVGRCADGRWTAPFVMAAINTRIVRRSNALLDYPYGRDFRYAELVRFPKGAKGAAMAMGMTGGLGVFTVAMAMRPTRQLLSNTVLPEPGQGPSRREREAGYFRITLQGEGTDADGRPFTLHARVEGDQDPGYGESAKMLGESALCLALDGEALTSPGGILTPATAMGMTLVERLRAAGMRLSA